MQGDLNPQLLVESPIPNSVEPSYYPQNTHWEHATCNNALNTPYIGLADHNWEPCSHADKIILIHYLKMTNTTIRTVCVVLAVINKPYTAKHVYSVIYHPDTGKMIVMLMCMCICTHTHHYHQNYLISMSACIHQWWDLLQVLLSVNSLQIVLQYAWRSHRSCAVSKNVLKFTQNGLLRSCMQMVNILA